MTKFTKSQRTEAYLFTVTRSACLPASETFFTELDSLCHSLGVKIYRYGRNRVRCDIPLEQVRKQGHVPIQYSDRWDVYVNRIGVYGRLSDVLFRQKIDYILRDPNMGTLLRKYEHLIEYANLRYITIFNRLFHPSGVVLTSTEVPPKVEPPQHNWTAWKTWKTENKTKLTTNKPMTPTPTLSTWQVTLKAELDIPGNTREALVIALKSRGFAESDIVSAEKLDSHRDLPLVEFDYPDGDRGYGVKLRRIRVISLDDEYLTGYDKEQYKKFRVDRVSGYIRTVEVPTREV